MLYEIILSLNAAYGSLVTISHVTSYVTDGIVRQLQCKLPQGFIVMEGKNVSVKATEVGAVHLHCNRCSAIERGNFQASYNPSVNSRRLWTPEIDCGVENCRPVDPGLSHINPFTIFPTYSLILLHPVPKTYGSQERS